MRDTEWYKKTGQ